MSMLIDNATIKIRRDTAGNWSSNNPTPLQGEWCLETDTGNIKIGDEITAWNDLGYRQQLPFTYTLTSNKTHTLPAITGFPQTESVYWTGGGTYKLTIKTNDGTPLDYEGEGEGHILVESDGSNWQVREYEDTIIGATQTVYKELKGKRMVIEGTFSETIDVSAVWGSIYTAGANAPKIIYLKSFTVWKTVQFFGEGLNGSWWPMEEASADTNDTLGFFLGVARATSSSVLSCTGNFVSTGTWA